MNSNGNKQARRQPSIASRPQADTYDSSNFPEMPASADGGQNAKRPKANSRQGRKVILKQEVNRLQSIVNDMQSQVDDASVEVRELKGLVNQLGSSHAASVTSSTTKSSPMPLTAGEMNLATTDSESFLYFPSDMGFDMNDLHNYDSSMAPTSSMVNATDPNPDQFDYYAFDGRSL